MTPYFRAVPIDGPLRAVENIYSAVMSCTYYVDQSPVKRFNIHGQKEREYSSQPLPHTSTIHNVIMYYYGKKIKQLILYVRGSNRGKMPSQQNSRRRTYNTINNSKTWNDRNTLFVLALTAHHRGQRECPHTLSMCVQLPPKSLCSPTQATKESTCT